MGLTTNRSTVSSMLPTVCPSTRSSTSLPTSSTPRLWRIGTRSNVMFLPYQAVLWGTFSATLYMMGRKAAGYNTWFGKN
ncbi:hypothetical protein PG995_013754 [Apiospora arundinis]